jgi:hypothetical protein
MEEWLSDKAAAIKPLKDDCREVEEVNRELDQRMFSYELVSIELRRLFDGLEVEPGFPLCSENPTFRLGRKSLQIRCFFSLHQFC